jgi:acetoin utilization protein AcuB
MIKKPTLAAAMTPFPYAVDLDAQVADAEALMQKHGIHHLPVTHGQDLVGIVTARDLAARAHHTVRVRDCYLPDPYIVELGTPLDEVLFRMAARHIGSAIVTRQGKLAGIFTHVDACRTFAAHLRAQYPEPTDDQAA